MRVVIAWFPCIAKVSSAGSWRSYQTRSNAETLELVLNQERDDDSKQRDSFDERREDDRARLNSPGHLRLARHPIHRLSGKTTDTNARADYGETAPNPGAKHRPCTGVLSGVPAGGAGNSLKQRKDRDHCVSPFNNRDMSCSRLFAAVRHRDFCCKSQRTS